MGKPNNGSYNRNKSNKSYGKKDSNSYKKKSYKRDTEESKETKPYAKKDVEAYVGSENDPKWYNRNSRLVQDATKISFATQLGTQFPLVIGDQHFDDGVLLDSVAGILALDMMNVPGIATSATDGVNIATAGLFQYIRKNLSTVATYAPADVMAVVLAIDEVYSMYANISRVFGIINAYSAINLYFPAKLLEAGYGFSANEVELIRKGLNNYRSDFNNLIFKASTLYLPTDFTVTSRHAWLYSNYFTDHNSIKAQLYIHRMKVYHEFDETSYPSGSALVAKEAPETLQGLLTAFNDMIDALRNSDSVLKIQADMKRAFETSSSWNLAYQDEGYMVLPSYSEEVLMQIHNTSVLPPFDDENWENGTFDVTQIVNSNTIYFNPVYQIATADIHDLAPSIKETMSYLIRPSKVLNLYKQDITSDDVAECTRNMLMLYGAATPPNYTVLILACGVDLCMGFTTYSMDNTYEFSQVIATISDPTVGSKQLCDYLSFDWAPIQLVETSYDAVNFVAGMKYAIDFANYTSVDRDAIIRLHRNIQCSMWSIPEIGGFAG